MLNFITRIVCIYWYLPTKFDLIGWSFTSERAFVVIICVAVSIRTARFEKLGIVYRPVAGLTRFWSIMLSTAAILICIKRLASWLASNNVSAAVQFQLVWTLVVDTSDAGSFFTAVLGAVALAIDGEYLKVVTMRKRINSFCKQTS